MKKLLIVVAVLFVFGLFSLGLVAACAIGAGRNFRFGPDENATRQETHGLQISAGETLRVDLSSGDIRVRVGEGTPSLSATITAWGDSQEEAGQALAEVKLEIARTADGARVTLREPSTEKRFGGLVIRRTAEADLEMVVPAGVKLEMQSGSGDIDAQGPFGSSKVHSSYGSVRVEQVVGDLEATSSSGDMVVADVRGGELVVRSEYGDVRIGDCDSTKIEVKSSSGDVRLEDVRGERVEAESGYGSLELTRIEGDLEAQTSSGDVHAEELTGARASLTTSYGSVRVEGSSGVLVASSSSGDVRIGGCRGSVEAHSEYGAVQVAGILTRVAATSSSGDVTVSAAPGSEMSGSWKLASSYGRMKLELPEALGCDLDARTDYGRIDLELPIEVAAGSMNEDPQSIRGKMNGGGKAIEIRCASGDVIIQPSANSTAKSTAKPTAK